MDFQIFFLCRKINTSLYLWLNNNDFAIKQKKCNVPKMKASPYKVNIHKNIKLIGLIKFADEFTFSWSLVQTLTEQSVKWHKY